MITVEKLTKSFGPKLAVDNISFSVEKGEVLGFLGPNGAGKSTSMRMITGFLLPSSGKISVCGFDVVEQSLEKPEQARLSAGKRTDVQRHVGLRLPELLRRVTRAIRQR